MFKKVGILTLAVLMALVVVGGGLVTSRVARAAGEQWIITGRLSSGCYSGDTFFSQKFVGLVPGDVYYADTIVKDFAGVVYMDEYFSTVAPGALDGDWGVFDINARGLQTGSFPLPAGQVLTMTVTLRDASQQVLTSTSVQFTCDGSEANVSSIPGCDALLDVPATAVVGSFVADAPLYWTPGELTSPLVTIPAGKTAWVLGTDDSGGYYKIVWACDMVYVPVSAMGPNYDAVWNGRPLPTSNAD
ncbi:MAG: hypothetical protein AB1435_13335 [Chloroflexota bacterium]|jgi:hypothetical protein